MATETTYRCDFPGCGKELEYGGRGRPPKRCDEHRGMKIGDEQKEEKVSETQTRSRPRPGGEKSETRPRPGAAKRPAPRIRPNPKGDPKDEPVPVADESEAGIDTGIKTLPRPGVADTKSRAKAEQAARRASDQIEETWPRGVNGTPMARVEFSASELIPTGQYANVSVGPVKITAFVDLDRDVDNGYFTKNELSVLVQAANELAETAERNVIAIQRNLVLESMQEQLSSNGK